MTTIHISDEHKTKAKVYIAQLEKYSALFKEQQQRFDHAKEMTAMLSEATQLMYKMQLSSNEAVWCRNAQIVTYFLDEARDADKLLALYTNIAQATKEALSFFLADAYNVPVSCEWNLRVDEGLLLIEETKADDSK